MDALAQFWADHPELARRKKTPTTYTITYGPLAASLAGQSAFFQSSADFVVTRIVGTQTTAGSNAAYILTPLLVQLVYTAQNMNFNAVKTEWSTSGIQVNPASNANPTDLPYPLFVPSGMQVTTLVDNPIAAASNLWINFIGIQCT